MAATTFVDLDHISGGLNYSDISRSFQLSTVSLPQPGGAFDDDATVNAAVSLREYMLISSKNQASIDIYEIQSVLPHGGKYASHFVGSRVVSNGCLHVSSRVDPLFFALAHFQRTMSSKAVESPESNEGSPMHKWQPWDQALANLSPIILRALNLDPSLFLKTIDDVGQLAHLLDVSDMCGDDLILCKFSEEKALKWLVAKFERAKEAIRTRMMEKKKRALEREKCARNNDTAGGNGAFSSTFNIGKEMKAAEEEKKEESLNEASDLKNLHLTEREETIIRANAMQLVCDYLSVEWADKLSNEVSMKGWFGKKTISTPQTSANSTNNGADASSGSQPSGQKRPRSSWEGNLGQEDADSLLQYTVGRGGAGGTSVITPADKNEAKNAKSVGLKRLAKVNTKGMKSLASFFGGGKKKK